MTDREINVAVALACGLQQPFKITNEWEEGPSDDGSGYDGFFDRLRAADGKLVPSYSTSLDACAEFEAGMAGEDVPAYFNTLCSIAGRSHMSLRWQSYFGVVTATARQRSEAFLRVKGLWRDGM